MKYIFVVIILLTLILLPSPVIADDTVTSYKAIVVITADDVSGWEGDLRATEEITKRQMVLTAGIISSNTTAWDNIKTMVDTGYVEIASHSRTHPSIPYGDYDSEIGGSAEDIKTNLGISPLAWLNPYGTTDETVLIKLKEYDYIVSRGITENYIIYGER